MFYVQRANINHIFWMSLPNFNETLKIMTEEQVNGNGTTYGTLMVTPDFTSNPDKCPSKLAIFTYNG